MRLMEQNRMTMDNEQGTLPQSPNGMGKKKKWFYAIGGTAIVATMAACITLGGLILPRSQWTADKEGYLYIDQDDTTDSVKVKSKLGWRMSLCSTLLHYHVRTGRYATKDVNALTLFRHLRNGQQEPVMLTIPCVRTLDRMAQYLGTHLMMNSQQALEYMSDSSKTAKLGYTKEQLPALFVPNTYEIYWDTSIDAFMHRMQQEHDRFWKGERTQKAKEDHLTPIEVCTLASIVDEETANKAEKPDIAAMYINRLQVGMPLQADPTVKFAVGDFSLRRIYHEHLKVQSPYNTYLNTGLPPGPIRVASIDGIEAVLNHSKHPYLYMCAKEDFSGTHRFATTYKEHQQNARRYAEALNQRGIR